MNKNKLFASVIGLLVFVAGLSAKDYQVAMFGIKSDGVTLNTRSIQRAVDISVNREAAGLFLCGPLSDWFNRA